MAPPDVRSNFRSILVHMSYIIPWSHSQYFYRGSRTKSTIFYLFIYFLKDSPISSSRGLG